MPELAQRLLALQELKLVSLLGNGKKLTSTPPSPGMENLNLAETLFAWGASPPLSDRRSTGPSESLTGASSREPTAKERRK